MSKTRSHRFEEVCKRVVPDGFDVVVSSVGGWAIEKKNLQVRCCAAMAVRCLAAMLVLI
jgi:hypothetical protein